MHTFDYSADELPDNLFGANGKLTRLHKFGKPKAPPAPAPPPPPVRESNRHIAKENESTRSKQKKRNGYESTVRPGSLLGSNDESSKGGKTLLG